jgi:hypothetical protein
MKYSTEELRGSTEEICGTQNRRAVWYRVLKDCMVHRTEELCGTEYWRTVWYIVLKSCVVQSTEELFGTWYWRTVWYVQLKNCVVYSTDEKLLRVSSHIVTKLETDGLEERKLAPILTCDKHCTHCFHSCTVHLDTIKVFYLPTDEQ